MARKMIKSLLGVDFSEQKKSIAEQKEIVFSNYPVLIHCSLATNRFLNSTKL